MERRTLITSTGLVLATSIAGCLGNDDSSPENETGGESENSTDSESTQNPSNQKNSEEPPQSDERQPSISDDPRDLLLKNYHDQTQIIKIRVGTDNKPIHTDEYELGKVGSDNIKRISDIVNETGTYSITAKLPEDRIEKESQWNVTDNSSNAVVYITEDNGLDIRPNQSM